MKINDIKNPDFIKKLEINELEELAKDIRNFLLENVSQTGGHLSSNLGIVDLTIAMFKVFDINKDKFIFDVGHQTYPFKILTGRASSFNTLRKLNGLNGFLSFNESIYDVYEAGHSSTSLSAGLGFAIARDLDNKKYNVISIIGDGSISNGLAQEALNHIGDTNSKQIIILNDNEMSISKNVGAMHNFLDSVRGAKSYNKAKENTKSFLKKIPLGKYVAKAIDKSKNAIKKIYLKKGSIFTEMGIEYYGPIHGHDYVELIKYLTLAKNENKSVILHVITQKGKGYEYAENDSEGKFHGIGAFDIKTGKLLKENNLPSYSEIISSYVYNYAKKDKDIICITPAMAYGSKLSIIEEKLPKQFIDVGISEEHSLILANALALNGKKPICFIYSTFLQRGYDQIVHDIARMNQNVIICVDRSGLVPGDGVSHQGVFDIPMLLSVPNVIISMPSSAKEANDLIYTALKASSPFIIRYPKINIKYDYSKAEELKIGSWEIVSNGNDGCIITYGDFVSKAMNIKEKLLSNNINLKIINARFIKPIDKIMLSKLINDNKPIFIYEESMKIGSLGSLITQETSKAGFKNIVITYGVEDEFLITASREELLEYTHLDEESIYKSILKHYKK